MVSPQFFFATLLSQNKTVDYTKPLHPWLKFIRFTALVWNGRNVPRGFCLFEHYYLVKNVFRRHLPYCHFSSLTWRWDNSFHGKFGHYLNILGHWRLRLSIFCSIKSIWTEILKAEFTKHQMYKCCLYKQRLKSFILNEKLSKRYKILIFVWFFSLRQRWYGILAFNFSLHVDAPKTLDVLFRECFWPQGFADTVLGTAYLLLLFLKNFFEFHEKSGQSLHG